MDRYQDIFAGLWRWSRDVVSLTLLGTQIMFGLLLVTAIVHAVRVHDMTPMGKAIGLLIFATCLRILIAPTRKA